jgi:hypothetical protein
MKELTWTPTVHIRFVTRELYGPKLQQLHYLYENEDGMYGAKVDERWQDVEVLDEKT